MKKLIISASFAVIAAGAAVAGMAGGAAAAAGIGVGRVAPFDPRLDNSLLSIEDKAAEAAYYAREAAENSRQALLRQQKAGNPDMPFPIAFTRLESAIARIITLNNGDKFKVSMTDQRIIHTWAKGDVVDVYEDFDKRGRLIGYTLFNVTAYAKVKAQIED